MLTTSKQSNTLIYSNIIAYVYIYIIQLNIYIYISLIYSNIKTAVLARNRLTDLENELNGWREEEWGEEIVREFMMDMYTLLMMDN